MSFRFVWLLGLFLLANPVFSQTIHDSGDAEAGQKIYENYCSTCHSLDGSVLSAPSLMGVAERWEGKDELIKQWVKNPAGALATGDPYVKSLVKTWTGDKGFKLMAAQPVSDEDIANVLSYTSSYVPPEDTESGGEKDWYSEPEQAAGSGNPVFWFLILAVIFAIIAVAASGVGRALDNSDREAKGEKPLSSSSYGGRAKSWIWENKVLVSILSIVILFFFIVPMSYNWALGINVMEEYRPAQDLHFNHKLHAGKNEINCEYCHNSASKSKHAGIPEPMLCMNCHAGIRKGHNDEATADLMKLYDAVGFDPEAGTYIKNYEQKPIVWRKVHNLPDHVFFPHDQHVAVAGLECQNCHGPVDQEYTIGQVATSQEIMALAEENSEIISLESDVLTMGWCIECHSKAEVNVSEDAENDYYKEIHDRLLDSNLGKRDLQKYLKDGTITVKELGGWECSKCHY